MFHFPWFALPPLCIQDGVTGHYTRRVSPFGNFRINVRLATPRNFSQPPTSFIASQRLGIHRTPLVAYNCLVLVDVDARASNDSRSRSRPLLFAADLSILQVA
jgi:hypothetical protein